MDSVEGGASYPRNPHDLGPDYESSQQPKLPLRSLSNPQYNVSDDDVENRNYVYDTESTEDDENMEEIRSGGQTKGILIGGDMGSDYDVDDDDDDDTSKIQDGDFSREEWKKRKLEALLSQYEFAPRAVVTPQVSKPLRVGRNSLTDWTEQESFALLEAWSERYLKHGRKKVRSNKWHEVAQKVSDGSNVKRTETQCRNRLDTLKKKYKKEKAMLAENLGVSSKWVYFSKMDVILSPSSNPENGYVSVEPKAHPNQASNPANGYDSVEPKDQNHANSPDEMKDGLVGDLELAAKGVSDNLEDRPAKRTMMCRSRGWEDPFSFLEDSISKLSNTYEKVHSSKTKQLVELEKMRMDFRRDLELEKREIMKKALVEIAKIRGLDSKVIGLSSGDGSAFDSKVIDLSSGFGSA